MTGGGFGGCVIALVPADQGEAVGDAVRRAVRGAGYQQPVVTRTHAAQGAGVA
jgi:galactokinase